MKVGTDFSGIGAPEMALNNLGIEYDQIFSCEIDKFARQSYLAMHQAPGKFYNDITKRNHSEVDQLDLYVAGFPCQAFSMAGERKGFDDVRGTLFFNVAEFIKINQPKMFVLENVKGLLSHDNGRTYQTITDILTNGGGTLNSQISLDVFDDGLGYHCYTAVLNTKDFGIPQNRERIFIVGFKEFRKFNFPAAEKLQLKLKDLLQDNPNAKYYLSKKSISGLYKGQQKPQVTDGDDVARYFTAGGNSGGMHSGMTLLVDQKYYLSDKMIEGLSKANERDNVGYKFEPTKGDGIAVCINTKEGQRDYNNYIKVDEKYYLSDKMRETFKNHKKRHQEKGTGFLWQPKDGDDIANTLRANSSLCPTDNSLISKDRIRRLTPLECFRLQAFPDDAFFEAQKVCSDTQLYKQAGNSISVNVLEKLFKQML